MSLGARSAHREVTELMGERCGWSRSTTLTLLSRMEARLPATELRLFWLSGAALMALWLFISNLRFAPRLRRSRRALHVEGCVLPVYISPEVDMHCLFGLFRLSIYLTPEAADSEAVLWHSVEHELTHFRHLDHIWALLRGACLALHWYNPLVW